MIESLLGAADIQASVLIPLRHPVHVSALLSALRLIEKVLSELAAGQSHDRRALLALALFVRLRELAKSTSVLLLYGQENAASVQLRSFFEVFVYLKNCCERPEFEKEYVGSAWKILRQMAQAGINNTGGYLSEEQIESWFQKKQFIDEQVAERGTIQLTVQMLAGKVGLDAWYEYFYRLGSIHTHGNFVSLSMRHLTLRKDGGASIDAGPRDSDFRLHSGTLVELVTLVVDALRKVYRIPLEEEINDLRRQHLRLLEADVINPESPNTAARADC